MQPSSGRLAVVRRLALFSLVPLAAACGARTGLPIDERAAPPSGVCGSETSEHPLLPMCTSTTTLRSFVPGAAAHSDTLCPDGCSGGACTGYPAGSVSGAERHSCAVTVGEAAKCWGLGDYGELGDGSTSGSLVPVAVVGLGSGVLAVEAAAFFTCALLRGGHVRCWGLNNGGQLGDGSNVDSAAPVDVVALGSGVVAISAGSGHTCALTAGGGVRCWGANMSGMLGDGSNVASASPVGVSGLGSGAIAVSAGASHTCALTLAGAVQCWGLNGYGQLGDGSTVDSSVPVDVVGLDARVVALEAGLHHVCALTQCGRVACWGRNVSGQLGDGSETDSPVPVDVIGLGSDVVALASHWGHTCALTRAGRVACWGSNRHGMLGDGATTDSLVPVDVVGLGSVVAIAAGWGHSCAVSSDEGVACWGHNADGELGDGSVAGSSVPVDVVGL